jgi:hypothetical protein
VALEGAIGHAANDMPLSGARPLTELDGERG